MAFHLAKSLPFRCGRQRRPSARAATSEALAPADLQEPSARAHQADGFRRRSHSGFGYRIKFSPRHVSCKLHLMDLGCRTAARSQQEPLPPAVWPMPAHGQSNAGLWMIRTELSRLLWSVCLPDVSVRILETGGSGPGGDVRTPPIPYSHGPARKIYRERRDGVEKKNSASFSALLVDSSVRSGFSIAADSPSIYQSPESRHFMTVEAKVPNIVHPQPDVQALTNP